MEYYDLQNLLNTVGFVDIEVGLISVCGREGMMTEIAFADSSTCITPNPVIRPKNATCN